MPFDFKKRRTLRSPTYKNEDGHITEQDKTDKADEGMDQKSMIWIDLKSNNPQTVTMLPGLANYHLWSQ